MILIMFVYVFEINLIFGCLNAMDELMKNTNITIYVSTWFKWAEMPIIIICLSVRARVCVCVYIYLFECLGFDDKWNFVQITTSHG